MSEKIMIKSISDFVNALSKLGGCNKDKSRFFRGHSDCCYQLIPSIYRKPYLIKNEHRIIQDAFTYCSEYFSENETLFEKLVKLQHYDYKTRLLDITSNALVALYFAIDTFREKSIQIDETKDGEVIILDLSALSLRDANFDIEEISVISKYNLEIEKHLRLISEKQILNHLEDRDREYFISLTREIEKLPKDDRLGMLRYMTIREFNSQEHITRLLNDIRKDKPYFLPIIKNEDFNNVLCVRSKFNNQRILRQHGSFLIFGIQNQKTENAVVNPKWVVSGDNAEFRFIIDGNSKSRILDELKFFCFCRKTLFPE